MSFTRITRLPISTSSTMGRYVVYDCDLGGDDAWGLIMLTKGEQIENKPKAEAEFAVEEYTILGVTSVQGNTDVDNVTNNTLRILDALDRTDIPVFKGCAQPILPRTWQNVDYYYGYDGLGDLKHEKDVDIGLVQQKHAVTAMYDFACQYPYMVDYILVGPLTNFALCINMYGCEFLNKVRNIYVMGGNIRGNSNSNAEFNFMMDPEAAHIVLENISYKTSLTILPWEPCLEGDFGITLTYRLEVLGTVKSKIIELMNRVDRSLIPKGYVNWFPCDAMLVAAYLFPKLAIAKSRTYHATVKLTGTHTRGQMVLDHLRQKADNVTIIQEIHKDNWRKIIKWTAGVPGSNIEDICN